MWTPDVYEGAPTPVTAFFAVAPKVAAMGLTLRVLFDAFPDAAGEWKQIIVFVAIASMALGSVAAIGQRNIKRLMAYSSIANVGFILVGVAAGTEAGVQAVLLYLVVYSITTIGAFVVILAMRRRDGQTESIDDLAGLMATQPLLAGAFIAILFSYVGIPPLPGFFGKFYVFLAAVEAGLWPLAVIGVLLSVVGAFLLRPPGYDHDQRRAVRAVRAGHGRGAQARAGRHHGLRLRVGPVHRRADELAGTAASALLK